MRKALLKLLFGLLAVVAAVSFLVPAVNSQVSGDSWPMFGRDLSHSWYSSSVAPRDNRTMWISKTEGQVRSSVAVVDNVIYTGSFGGQVYAINALTGRYFLDFQHG